MGWALLLDVAVRRRRRVVVSQRIAAVQLFDAAPKRFAFV